MVIPVDVPLNRTVLSIIVTLWLRVAVHARVRHDAFQVVSGIGFDKPAGLNKVLDGRDTSALVQAKIPGMGGTLTIMARGRFKLFENSA